MRFENEKDLHRERTAINKFTELINVINQCDDFKN